MFISIKRWSISVIRENGKPVHVVSEFTFYCFDIGGIPDIQAAGFLKEAREKRDEIAFDCAPARTSLVFIKFAMIARVAHVSGKKREEVEAAAIKQLGERRPAGGQLAERCQWRDSE
jgi:hypothetical protein